MGTFSIALAAATDCREGARLLTEQLEEHGIEASIERLARVLEELAADIKRGFLVLARDRGRMVGVAYVAIIMSAEHCGPSHGWRSFMSGPIIGTGESVRRWLLRSWSERRRLGSWR